MAFNYPALRECMREDAAFDVAAAPADGHFGLHAPPPPPRVPKLFLSNNCIFNCAYCGCRQTRDRERYALTPREMAAAALREKTNGVFITSAIYKNPHYTQELLAETARLLRQEFGYKGYLHVKVMPGADPLLIEQTARYANRLSVNLEVANSEGYALLAKQKNRRTILEPFERIAALIAEGRPGYATSQSTQIMAGSTGETDFTLLRLASALYKKYALRRVYYTPFTYREQAQGYALPLAATPPWRVARLYQADRLMALYGFLAEELAPEGAPLLSEQADPKLAYALRNPALFPVDLSSAPYELLLRVPGVGVTTARRILAARREGPLHGEYLSRMGMRLRQAAPFALCGGKVLVPDQLSFL